MIAFILGAIFALLSFGSLALIAIFVSWLAFKDDKYIQPH
jgi:hypothetical protein